MTTPTLPAPWVPPPGPVHGPPRPPRPPATPALAVRAAAAGLIAAALVPGSRLGAGVVVAAGALAVAAPPGLRLRTRYGAALAAVSAGLVSIAVLRDAAWVVGLCLVGALATWSLLLSGEKGWKGVAAGTASVLTRTTPALPWVLRPLLVIDPRRRSGAGPVLRGAAAAALLLAVFGGLFASADAAFRELLGRLALPAPGPLLPGRVATALAVAAVAGAAAQVLAAPAADRAVAPYAGRVLRPVEWVLPLFVLDLLFAAFVTVQLAVLFGGRDHVLRTADLTYAQYAREGFAQLVVTALLTLAVVAVCARVVPRGPRTDRLLQALLGMLCLLTLVVLASASRRLGLYEQEYGFTRLRLSVDATIGWLAVVLLLVLVAGARLRAPWLPRAVVLSAAAGLLAFALSDPDARIAARNVERFAATGDLDRDYLSRLSSDAVPALQRLPEPDRSCVLRSRRLSEDGVAGWNVARSRARASLVDRPPAECG